MQATHTSTIESSSKKKRVHQIDLFRFIAALSVLLYHYFFIYSKEFDSTNIGFEETGEYFKYGYLGVHLFFIISGFVIALSIGHKSMFKFAVSRISRLYPIYWISVIFTFTVIVLFGAPQWSADSFQLLLNLTMFQNYLGIKNIDGVYWTLFVEMKFYIFIIGTYLLINKIKSLKIDHLIVSWMLLIIVYNFFNELYFVQILNFFLILEWGSFFVAGIIFYQIFKEGISKKYTALILLSLIISIHQSCLEATRLASKFDTTFSPFIVTGIITTFYLLMTLISTNKLKKINTSYFTALGALTYPLYLIHQTVGYIVIQNLNPFVNIYILTILVTLSMLFLSSLLSKKYEPKIASLLKMVLEQSFKKYTAKKI
jgi:peptidoglycan/LPS O-acetylase OafA/YrhL